MLGVPVGVLNQLTAGGCQPLVRVDVESVGQHSPRRRRHTLWDGKPQVSGG
jgi:hypothetical protein